MELESIFPEEEKRKNKLMSGDAVLTHSRVHIQVWNVNVTPEVEWGGGSRKSYIDIKKVDIRCWKRKVSAYWGHLKTMVELGGELEDCGFFSSRGR